MLGLLGHGIAALLLSACPPGVDAEAAFRRLEARDPDRELAADHQALASCGQEAISPERQAYLAAIGKVLEVEGAAALLYPAGGKAIAQSALHDAAKSLAAYPHLAARLVADARAMDRVDALLAKVEERKWAEVARLGAVVRVDPAVARVTDFQLRRRLQEAERQAKEETGAFATVANSVKEPLALLLKLLGTFAVGAGFVALVRRSAGKKTRYDIAFYDHSKGVSAPDDLLKARLLDELRLLSMETTVTAEQAADLGTIAVMHSPGPVDQLQEIASKIDPSAVVGIGLLRVPLGTLWLWLARALYPATSVWRGDLSRHAGETRLELRIHDRGARPRAPLRVRVPGVDEGALAAAIRQMAYRIVHADLKDPPTRSPEAFACYEAAHALLARAAEGTPREACAEARELLERAAAEDPGFAAARIRLANVVGRLGELDLAAAMIDELGKKLRSGDRPAELRYEEARIHAQFQDYGRVRKALRLTDALLESKDLTRAVELNARSLRATIAAALLMMLERESGDERKRLESTLEKELKYFDGPVPPDMDRKAFALAGALARTAHGKLLVATGSGGGALIAFRSVLIGHPDLVSAQLGLAMAYRKKKPQGWFDQARPCLERAERLAPESDDVHYEFGSALLDRQPPDVAAAKGHLEKAAKRSPSALYKLGVLVAEEARAPLDGLRHIFRAIQARGISAPPFWTEKLVRIASGIALKEPEALSLSEAALRSLLDGARDAGKTSTSDSEAEKADRLMERRQLRRYLVRASDLLATALADMPPAPPGAATASARALVKTLRGVEDLVASDKAAGTLDPKDEGRAASFAKHCATIESMLAKADPKGTGGSQAPER